MTWDYFVSLSNDPGLQETLTLPEGLAGGFVDEVSVRFFPGRQKKTPALAICNRQVEASRFLI